MIQVPRDLIVERRRGEVKYNADELDAIERDLARGLAAPDIGSRHFLDATIRRIKALQSLPDSPLRRSFLARGLHAIALNSIHLQDLEEGLEVARQAIELLAHPVDREEEAARSLVEVLYAQLLVAKGHHMRARERALLGVTFAQRSGSARADFHASLTLHLADVHLGKVEEGLHEFEVMRASPPGTLVEVRQLLLTCAWAYERAGLHAKAADAHREWFRRIQSARVEGIANAAAGREAESPATEVADHVSLIQLQMRVRKCLAATSRSEKSFLGERLRPAGWVAAWTP